VVLVYSVKLVTAAKHIAGICNRLRLHICGHYLKQLATALLMGKLNFSAAIVANARLSCHDDDVDGDVIKTKPATAHAKAVQVQMNRVARSVTGSKQKDHVKIVDLLSKAGFPSYNQIVIKNTAMEAYKALKSSDGPNSGLNPLGMAMSRPTRSTRSQMEGLLPNSHSVSDTFAQRGLDVWNSVPELRNASTILEAKRVACKLAKDAPI
jgi:hypothetical protein